MRRKMLKWWGLALLGWAGLVAAEEPLWLVQAGQPRAALAVAGDAAADRKAPPAVAAAALQGCLERLTGTRLPQLTAEQAAALSVQKGRVTGPANLGPAFVLLGESELTRALGVTREGLGPGGFAVRTVGNALVIVGTTEGPDPHGLRAGVVALLEALGGRYLWPGPSGLVLPRQSSLAVPPLDRRFTPPVVQRSIRIQPTVIRNFERGLAALGYTRAEWTAAQQAAGEGGLPLTWAEWHGLNGYVLGIVGGHNGCGLGSDGWARYGKEHPEWGALQPDGTRDQSPANDRFRLCVSNPELAAFVADLIIAQVTAKPATVSVSLSPQDGGYSNFCVCERCRRLDPPEAPKIKLLQFKQIGKGDRIEVEAPALTDRYVHYWNAVAERVTRVHPKLLFVIDAYSAYATPPVRERLHPNLVVRYVPSEAEGWSGWQQAGATRLFWRPNNLHSGYREAAINRVAAARPIVDATRALAAQGLLAADIQGIYGNWATQGFPYYATARALYNPALTHDELLAEYCAGFGPAAAPVRAYLEQAAALGLKYEGATPAAMAALQTRLDEAAQAAAGDEALLARLAFLRAGLEYSVPTAQAGQLRLAAEAGTAPNQAAVTTLLDQRWRLMRELFRRAPLAVNFAVVAGYDDTNWRALGWTAPSPAVRAAALELPAATGADAWLHEDQTPGAQP